MKTAILFTGKFGSTRQYAQWISEATGYPYFDLNRETPDLSAYDAFILGSSIIVMKPTIAPWLRENWSLLKHKPVLLYTVSGTEPGHPALQEWVAANLPPEILDHITYKPLRGRLDVQALPLWTRIMLLIGSLMEKDPKAKNRMRKGFDFMDKSSIRPIVDWAAQYAGSKLTAQHE